MNLTEVMPNVQSFVSEYFPYFLTASVLLILYAVYLYNFKYFVTKMNGKYDHKKKNIGNPIPPFPMGWWIACRSREVAKGESKAVDMCGQNIVVFRSDKGEVYALDAYCKHMGANLGIGGRVVNSKCIQCPFHGWLYDGESG